MINLLMLMNIGNILLKIFNQKTILLYCKKTKVNNANDISKIINYGNLITDKL